MADKKLELKRLLIYLAFAFGLAWIIFFACYCVKGVQFGKNQRVDAFVGLGMLAPFLANLITRKITNEGFTLSGKDSLLLGISFKNKKWIYFILAIILPWVFNETIGLLMVMFNPEAFDGQYYKELEIDKKLVYISPLIIITSACISSFAALGEEGGWRGYMMPKLCKLIGMKKALIAGGVIWGIWHLPLTCVGHNFGTEYPGFPYVGILLMCVFCTFTGIILTFITLKSQSIWPAAIMHAVINASPGIIQYFINENKLSDSLNNPLFMWGLRLVPTLIAALICLIIIFKKEKA